MKQIDSLQKNRDMQADDRLRCQQDMSGEVATSVPRLRRRHAETSQPDDGALYEDCRRPVSKIETKAGPKSITPAWLKNARCAAGAVVASGVNFMNSALEPSGVASRVGWVSDRTVEELKPRWAPPPSEFVEIDHMQVHYRDEGPRDDPSPLVLIHGTGSSLHTWDGCVSRLAKQHRVIRFDRPGFGLTGPSPTDSYGFKDTAGVVLRLADHLSVDKFAVGGNSSGGQVAWQTALLAPQRVSALVLVASTGYPSVTPLPMAMRVAMSPLMGPMLQRVLPRSSVESGVRSMYYDPSKVTPEVIDRNYELTLRTGNRRALGESLRQAQFNEADKIAQIRTPTLILWGGHDVVVPQEDAEHFHRDIPGSKIVIFQQAGHVLHEEVVDFTAMNMMTFLSTIN